MRYVNLAIVLVFRLVSMKGSEISKGTLSFKYVQKNNENIVCQIDQRFYVGTYIEFLNSTDSLFLVFSYFLCKNDFLSMKA